jgi:ribosome-associated heat shock protein Hsp15
LQRIDKYLWYARFFKSRTLAAAIVSAGAVRINGERCEKPSAVVKLGDVLTFSAGPRVRVIKVLNGGGRRGPASEARTLYEDLTPAPQAQPVEPALPAVRDKGAGRPTKKERRDMAAFTHDELDD